MKMSILIIFLTLLCCQSLLADGCSYEIYRKVGLMIITLQVNSSDHLFT